MKKLLGISVITLCLLLSCKEVSAQDIILTKDSEIIKAHIEEITDIQVFYRNFEDTDGQLKVISLNDIAKIQYSDGSEEVFSDLPDQSEGTLQGPYAPILPRNERLVYKRGKFFVNGTPLERNAVESYIGSDLFDNVYTGAHKQYTAGNVLAYVSIGFDVASILLLCTSTYNENDWEDWQDYVTQNTIGYWCLSAGILTLGGSLIFHFIGNGRMKWIAEEHNYNASSYGSALSFGVTPHGMGLTLNF